MAKQLYRLIDVLKVQDVHRRSSSSSTSWPWSRSAPPTTTGPRSSRSSSSTRAASSTSRRSRHRRAQRHRAGDRLPRRAAGRLRHQGAGPHRHRGHGPRLQRRRHRGILRPVPCGSAQRHSGGTADARTHVLRQRRRPVGARRPDRRHHRLRQPGPRPRAEPARLRASTSSSASRRAPRAGRSPRRPACGSRTSPTPCKAADVIMIAVPDTVQKAVYDAEIAPNLRPGAAADVRPRLQHPVRAHHAARRRRRGHGRAQGPGPPAALACTSRAAACRRCSRSSRTPSGTARARVLAYARGLGSTRAGVLETTFKEETETDLFGEQALLCGGVSALVKAAFETLVEAGYQPELAYFETMHELKLIVDLMYRGGLNFMRFSVSDTAEYGDYVSGPRVTEGAKAAMKDVLTDIQSGLVRGRAGSRTRTPAAREFQRLREQDRDHQIEQVGARPPGADAVPQPGRGRGRPGPGVGRARYRRGRDRDDVRGHVAPASAAASRPAPIRIFDTTLRDGEQAPGAGADRRREAGGRAPARAPQGGRHRGRLPGRLARRLRGGPAGSPRRRRAGSPWPALARCQDGDPQRAVEAIGVAERPHLHLFIATSDIHLKHKLRMSPRGGPRGGASSWVALRPRDAGPRRRDRVQRRGRLAHRARRSCCEVYEAVVEAGATDGQHPGHRRLRHPGRVRARSSARVVDLRRQRRRHQRPLPQRPGPRHGQHAGRRPGRRAPGRGHHQRPRRARRQRRRWRRS